jgi:hypothetical protein
VKVNQVSICFTIHLAKSARARVSWQWDSTGRNNAAPVRLRLHENETRAKSSGLKKVVSDIEVYAGYGDHPKARTSDSSVSTSIPAEQKFVGLIMPSQIWSDRLGISGSWYSGTPSLWDGWSAERRALKRRWNLPPRMNPTSPTSTGQYDVGGLGYHRACPHAGYLIASCALKMS